MPSLGCYCSIKCYRIFFHILEIFGIDFHKQKCIIDKRASRWSNGICFKYISIFRSGMSLAMLILLINFGRNNDKGKGHFPEITKGTEI